mgnify:CR=1 FL=1
MTLENILRGEHKLTKKSRDVEEPKILFFDIETAPNLAYVWGKYDQNVIAYDSQWYMLTYAYKWAGEKTTHGVALPDFKLYKKDPTNDKELVKSVHQLFSEADIIVAHNGDQFDIRKTNARFLVQGLPPPEPYKTVDTKKVAKKHFNFNSNSLDDLGETLGLGRKDKHNKYQGFDLWLGCLKGDDAAWAEMVKYNRKDVDLLEKVYMKLRPWSTTHPNMALYAGKELACTNCASDHVQRRGYSYTKTGKNQRYQCLDCSAWSIERRAEKQRTKLK